MSGAKNIGPASSSSPAPTRLRQIALVTNDLARAKHLLVWETAGSQGIQLTEDLRLMLSEPK